MVDATRTSPNGASYLCIDADAHLTEARDTWTSRVPAKYRDSVPVVRLVEPEQREYWFLGDRRLAPVGITACAGYDKPFPDFPPTYEKAIPAAYDAKARLAYMDSAGIWAQVLYPNVGGFAAGDFFHLTDTELKLACVRAYNDFLFDWTSEDPRRFVMNVAMPFWDIREAVKEVERCAARGFRGINFTAAPQSFGLPYLSDRHWDPLWSVAVEAGLPISFHIGSGDMMEIDYEKRAKVEGMAAAVARVSAEAFLSNGIQLNDLLFSGVCARFPKIKFVSVESGIGWIPFVLEAADYQFTVNNVAKERPEFKMLPSEYFRQSVYACYWFEKDTPPSAIETIGPGNILFETDFPHPTCLYGNIVETINSGFIGASQDLRNRILVRNAAGLYNIELPASLQ